MHLQVFAKINSRNLHQLKQYYQNWIALCVKIAGIWRTEYYSQKPFKQPQKCQRHDIMVICNSQMKSKSPKGTTLCFYFSLCFIKKYCRNKWNKKSLLKKFPISTK